MSDLHNLSAPIEDSAEDVVKKQEVIKISQREKRKEDLKRLLYSYKQKYLKKLFISLGIAITICIILVWGIAAIFGNNTEPVETTNENVEDEPTETDTVKFIKFDGHQYYFYVPESYSFLNRTRNDDLSEVVFSNEKGESIFVLQEFEAANDNEETLDSIYSYIATTVPPSESTSIKIGDNTFKRRIYKDCQPKSEETLRLEAETGETMPMSVSCAVGDVYYSTYINGIVIIFERQNHLNEEFEENVLNTFTKNVISQEALTEEYIYNKLPSVKNKLQARFAFGPTFDEQNVNNISEFTWKTSEDFIIILDFDMAGNFTYGIGEYPNSNFTFNLHDAAANKNSTVSVDDVYHLIREDRTLSGYLTANSTSEVYVSDKVPNDNFWEVTILSKGTDKITAEYTVTKDTRELESAVIGGSL